MFYQSDIFCTFLQNVLHSFRCIVSFGRDEVVKVEKKDKKDKKKCDNKFEGGKVCVWKHEDKRSGIYACQLEIDDMNEDLEGIKT